MALVSENPTAALGGMSTKNRISFREGLNDTRHYDEDDNGFSSDEDESEYEDDHDDTSKDPETAEIASMEKRALKYRRSITMLNKLAGMNQATDHDEGGADGAKRPTRDHLLAAKKSIDDLTAWVNAAALDDDDDLDDD
ncbi:hypothetical protein BGZ58_009846 [Dissophora ornata]|nr:hypothetical protein BGZ58_009846 [Dissophora ornata]